MKQLIIIGMCILVLMTACAPKASVTVPQEYLDPPVTYRCDDAIGSLNEESTGICTSVNHKQNITALIRTRIFFNTYCQSNGNKISFLQGIETHADISASDRQKLLSIEPVWACVFEYQELISLPSKPENTKNMETYTNIKEVEVRAGN